MINLLGDSRWSTQQGSTGWAQDFFIDSENFRGSPTNALNLVKRGTVRARTVVTPAHKKWLPILI